MSECITTLAVVPARSGSKGVANKNIKKLGGRPLICWSAEALEEIQHKKDVLAILSTDSQEYAEIGQTCGLNAPFLRPPELANDTATAVDVALHAVDWFKHEYGYQPQQLMWLQPTSPFRSPEIIDQALDLIAENQAEAVVGCKTIYRDLSTLFTQNNGFIQALDAEQPHQNRRQEVNALLTPNGAMYLIKTDVLIQQRKFYPSGTLPLVMDAVSSHDIDEPQDWQIADAYVNAGLSWLSSENISGRL